MKEEWKDVYGYEELYEVSNLGRVRNKPTKRMVTIMKNNSGYLEVGLNKNAHRYNEPIHRLVAKTFLENPKGYEIVHHKDEIKTNNEASNLQWTNIKMNTTYSLGTKVVQIDLKTNKPVEYWCSLNEIGRNGYNQYLVSACCKKEVDSYLGYRWEYLDWDKVKE